MVYTLGYMMKTIVFILIIGGAVFGGYSLLNKHKLDSDIQIPNQEVAQDQDAVADKPEGKKMAFSEFAKQGGSYKCDVKQVANDFDSSGTVYIDKGQMKGEFSTVAEGINVKSYIIMKEGFIYTWSSSAPKFGAKMAIKDQGQNDNSGVYTWNPEQIGDYSCEPWTVDESQFTIPSSTTFALIK
jgi:hypothetical protein